MTPEDKKNVSKTPDNTNINPKVNISQLFAEYGSTVEEINKTISSIKIDKNLFDINIKGVADSISQFLKSIDLQFDSWASANNQIFGSIRKSTERISKAAPILYKHKWFITPSLPYQFVLEVSEIALSKKKIGMDLRHAFIHHFFDYNYYNTEQLVEGWRRNPLFEPRMKIFRDCLAVLRSSNDQFNAANVIIPTLIAQIDGILGEYLLQSCGFLPVKTMWKDQNGKKYSKTDAYDSLFKNSNPSSLDDFIIESGNDFILEKLFQTAYMAEPMKVPFSLSRHKIMHGEYLKYGKKENLVRLFLTLDFLYCLDDSGREAKSGA